MSTPIRWTPRARTIGNVVGAGALLTLGAMFGLIVWAVYVTDAAIERGAL